MAHSLLHVTLHRPMRNQIKSETERETGRKAVLRGSKHYNLMQTIHGVLCVAKVAASERIGKMRAQAKEKIDENDKLSVARTSGVMLSYV